MPTIVTLDSIKLMIYFGDHAPPHFHAFYNEYEILVEIETLATYRGGLPSKQYKKLLRWAEEHQIILRNKWAEFNPKN